MLGKLLAGSEGRFFKELTLGLWVVHYLVVSTAFLLQRRVSVGEEEQVQVKG